MKDYAKGRVKYGGDVEPCLVRDRGGWSYPGHGNTADMVREACAEAISDTMRRERRRAASIVEKYSIGDHRIREEMIAEIVGRKRK